MFLGFQFLSCEVEPLKGEFPQENPNDAEPGKFIAKIEGQEFIADSVYAILSEEGILSISGSNSREKQILLTIENAMESRFDITATDNNQNSGIYRDGSISSLPYISMGAIGGNGQMTISQLDIESNLVSGTFSFKGVRFKLGPDGMPLLDGSDNPILEEIKITSGAFNSIPLRLTGTGGDPGDDPENEFFAKVNGVGFTPTNIRVRDSIIADVRMFKVTAQTSVGERITIDIPRSLGEGTFAMESLSDGTKLIGIYKERSGRENLTSNPGSITITEFDLIEGVLKANFRFTGKDPLGSDPTRVEITEGKFTIYFEGVPGAIPAFIANIDGVSYSPEDFTTTSSIVNQYPRVTISSQVRNKKLEISFPTTLLEGTYDFGSEINLGNEVIGTYIPIVGTSIRYVSQTGSLIITSYDLETGIIKGTFNFTASDPSGQDPTVYQITAGEFLIIL